MKPIQLNAQLTSNTSDFALPDNLVQLVSPGELVQWTLEAVQAFLGRTCQGIPSAGGFNPRILLTLLTYSYATGTFGSAAIAEQCGHDAVLRYLSTGINYAPDRIRLFRGQNPELVKRSLAFLIRRVHTRRVCSSKPAASDALSEQEARWRLQRASQADGNIWAASVRAGARCGSLDLPVVANS